METVQAVSCPQCGTHNPETSIHCQRCGQLLLPDAWPGGHAQGFAQRELNGPFFGRYRKALDFSAASLRYLDAVLLRFWGEAGLAPGVKDWRPPPGKLAIILNLGAYLGEVFCRVLPGRWKPDPKHPQHLPGARVIDRQGRIIDPFVLLAARVRDGATVRLASLLAELQGVPAPPTVDLPPAPSTPSGKKASVQTMLMEADAAVSSGLVEQAIERYRALLALAPDHGEARRELAQVLASMGQFDAALKELEPLKRDTDPETVEARAQVQAQAGRIDEAAGTLEMGLLKQPGHLGLKRLQALLKLRAGQWSKAQQSLEALVAQKPDDAELLIGLAHALKEQGAMEPARKRLQQLLALPAIYRPPQVEQLARQRLKEWQPG